MCIRDRVWGGRCLASPSTETAAGRAVLEKDPNCPGSLGIAISEAVEAAVSDPTGQTRYALGSVLNPVPGKPVSAGTHHPGAEARRRRPGLAVSTRGARRG